MLIKFMNIFNFYYNTGIFMQKKIFLSTCISLTLAAFLGCKNSNNDIQSSHQLNTKAVSSNFAASYGEDFNYYYSGYKKCELDDEKTYFYEEKKLDYTLDEECIVSIDKITLKSKNLNGENIVFTKVSTNDHFVIELGEDRMLKKKLKPILFRSLDGKYTSYLDVTVHKGDINFHASEPRKFQPRQDKIIEVDENNHEYSLYDNGWFYFSSDVIPKEFIDLEIKSKFKRSKGSILSKYNDRTSYIKKTFSTKYNVTDLNCKIVELANFTAIERSDYSKLEGCLSKNLELDKTYSLIYSQSGSWDESTLWYAEFSFDEYSLEAPNEDSELVKKEQDELTSKFNAELDDYIKNIYAPDCNKFDKESNRVRKLNILTNKFKRFYKSLDYKYENRSYKNYIPFGFEFSADEKNVLIPIITHSGICSSEGQCFDSYEQYCPKIEPEVKPALCDLSFIEKKEAEKKKIEEENELRLLAEEAERKRLDDLSTNILVGSAQETAQKAIEFRGEKQIVEEPTEKNTVVIPVEISEEKSPEYIDVKPASFQAPEQPIVYDQKVEVSDNDSNFIEYFELVPNRNKKPAASKLDN